MSADIEPATIHKVLLLLVTLQDREAVAAACLEAPPKGLGIDAEDLDGVLDEASRQLTIAAEFSRDEEIGKAVIRLNDLYERSLRVQDVKTALASVRELHKLLGVYAPAKPQPRPAAMAAVQTATLNEGGKS